MFYHNLTRSIFSIYILMKIRSLTANQKKGILVLQTRLNFALHVVFTEFSFIIPGPCSAFIRLEKKRYYKNEKAYFGVVKLKQKSNYIYIELEFIKFEN